MSKQFGDFSESEIIHEKTNGKKNKGKYELWGRLNPETCDDAWRKIGLTAWSKMRSYVTKELAEENRDRQSRKNSNSWEFEVREKK